jgi:hypothetical protein
VTQGEYAALVGRIPNTGAGALDVGDSFPVYNVSWYDAVLYCNRRSNQERYDTVYSYTNICQDPACPWVLENLEIHYDRFGYRLPTEAEWEYACRAGETRDNFWGDAPDSAAAAYAWYYVNSGSRSQRVCRLKPNALGLYDMAGNLAEWVNDWLDFYADTLTVDPVGPARLLQEQYEATGERPVRGGSWRLGTLFLRSSCRKGPYRTSAFTAQKDIGFRVALGAFKARATDRPHTAAESLSVALACDKTTLFNFIGTNRVKLVLVVKQGERRNLVFADFSEPGTPVRRCGTDTLVFGPSISPDGAYVAYSSQGEGFSGPSLMTIRRLDSAGSNPARQNGYLPRFWVSPATRDTFVIFADGASPNTLPRWLTEKTYRQAFRGGAWNGAPAVLWGIGSHYGGLSSDGRFLGTSYPFARLVDLQIRDSAIYYFFPPWNGRDDWPQVCNLAMSPSLSEPGEALLLDFGYPKASTLLGKSYGLHGVIFICNARLLTPQHVSGWFEKPSGYDQWEYPDWSNHAGFMVSAVRTSSGSDEAVYVVRRADSAYLKIATGRNLSYPALWIDPKQVAETPDPYRSFGAYDIPVQWWAQVVLAQKLRLFWHYATAPACVVVGSSPAYYGVNTEGMKRPTLNIAVCGTDAFTNVVIARDYVLPHAPQVKAIVFDLMPGLLNRDWRKEPPQLIGLYDSKGYELDAQNNFYRAGLPAAVAQKAASYSPEQWPTLDSTGYALNKEAGSGWGQPIIDRADYDFNDPFVQSSLAGIADLADSAAAKKVHLLIVCFPEHPGYAQTNMIGRYGPGPATFAKIVAWLDTLSRRNPYAHFYDANANGTHDFTSDEALDCNHLNYKGGLKMAARIDSVIQTFGVPGR